MLSFLRIVVTGLLLAMPAAASAALKNGEYHTVLNGVRHWYRIAGAEHHTTPIVIVHGGPGGSAYNFEHGGAGARIEKFATVVYYDQRGSGRSDAPAYDNAYAIPLLVSDLEALRQSLHVDKITPLGYSFGGELALEYAVRHPEHLDHLIIQSSSNGDWVRTVQYQTYGFMLLSTGKRLAELEKVSSRPVDDVEQRFSDIWDGASRKEVDRLLYHNPSTSTLVDKLTKEGFQRGSKRNSGKMEKVVVMVPRRSPPLISELHKIPVPTLVMVGLYDRNVGVDSNREIADVIPHSKLVIFENSAHFPDLEEPAKYAETIRTFLQGRR